MFELVYVLSVDIRVSSLQLNQSLMMGYWGKFTMVKWIIIMALDHGMDNFVGIPERSMGEVVYFRQGAMPSTRCSFVWEVILRR